MWAPTNEWDVSRVKDFSDLFVSLTTFNQPIGNWDTSQVTSLAGSACKTPAHLPLHLQTHCCEPPKQCAIHECAWLLAAFQAARAVDQPIGDWDISQVTRLEGSACETPPHLPLHLPTHCCEPPEPSAHPLLGALKAVCYLITRVWLLAAFISAVAFDQPIGDWDVSRVTTLESSECETPPHLPLRLRTHCCEQPEQCGWLHTYVCLVAGSLRGQCRVHQNDLGPRLEGCI